MLYNESTGKPKVQADVFSLTSLIAWLETMPADKEYDFRNCSGECLLDQYGEAATAAMRNWTPEQFWEYADGLLGTFVRDQMRDMMTERGLCMASMVPSAERATATNSGPQKVCLYSDGCPPDGPVCNLCAHVQPRAGTVVTSTMRESE